MQKIVQNLKHKHRNVKIRFNLDQEFNHVLSNVHNKANQQEIKLFTTLIGDSKNNIRQKLKVIKRVVQSKDERQIHLKQIAASFLLDLHLKEYIFGNTQSKPSLLNILKHFNEIIKITSLLIIKAFESISLQQFSEARNAFELLQAFGKGQQSEQLLIRFEPAKAILLIQFQSCYRIVFSQGFKLKWLQYLVDVLRSLNGFIKIYGKLLDRELQKKILQKSREMTTQFKVLTKQVLTQLFMIIVFLNPEQPAPKSSQGNCLIHYYHAKNVVLGVNILKDLLVILVTIKQMQYRCQLVPILLKAFQEHYSTYQDKNNVFDQVVTLFDVGRSVYNYLEQIVTIIIRDPQSQWNLEGSYLKKFFIATVALKQNISINILFNQWPTIISDIITHAGSMTTPYVNDCALILLQRLFQDSNREYKKWSEIWINDYKKALLSNDRGQVRGIIEFINPILLSINSEPYLLREMLALSQKEYSIALQMGVIALLKCYKDLGKIQIENVKKLFIHSQDNSLYFSSKQISELILSSDSTIALKTLQFVTVHPKGSQPMEPLELELSLYFYKHCLKTSLPQYRKSYINATKKMFQRLRTTYDAQLTKTAIQLSKIKRYKPKLYFSQFKVFLSNLIDLCFQNVFPDVIFQIANPALEILLLIGQFFSRKVVQIKKGQNYEASFILNQTNYFLNRNFDNLLCCLQSSYQSVRLLSHQILQLFFDLSDEKKLKQLWSESLENANKLTIKSYEYACRILALISQVFPHVISLPSRFSLQQLNICQYFLKIIQDRYQIFRVQFASQEQNYYKNLIHGMLTVFSYTLDNLATKLRANPQQFIPHFSQIKIFLKQFFDQINNIVLFSVEVCSSNISTVVLDSLPQSQTDKKYKVDCRGHFLQETGNKGVSGLIQSTALLTSMENEEQGIQNTLVVSFYLLTREAGLVFQSIGNIAATSHSHQYLPAEALVQLVNSYFYALINLKHMGSVDRIAGGLGKMARLIFDNEDPRLSELPQRLLDKLIENLKLGNFTNILRRSAGVPYAFTCLLKSEALKRRQMIQKTLTTLLELSRNENVQTIELRIHSLNILKKLFQDGDLKSDLERFVSIAFMSSIKGFTSQEWGVRNSSLMLFTILANRTVGIKPTYNLLQFFHRCPQLLDFFSQQLRNMELNTMYPPLYPIVLLLSRLLPFDLSERVKLPNKGDLNLKQIRKDKLLEMLPLIQRAGLNNNHMGRVMAAKSILPFMDIDGIVPYCLNLLKNIKQIKDNNFVHYRLTTVYQLLVSLHQLQNQQKYESKLNNQVVNSIVETLLGLNTLVRRKQSAVVTESILKLIHHLLNHFYRYISKQAKYDKIVSDLLDISNKIIDNYFVGQDLIMQMNLGHSMAVKQCLYLHSDLLHKYQNKTNTDLVSQSYSKFLNFLTGKISQKSQYLKHADTEIIQTYLMKIVTFLREHSSQQQLNNMIIKLLNSLSLQEIASDAILIKVLQLRAILKISVSSSDQEYLNITINQTHNHFLQIAAFKYFQSLDLDHPQLLTLLNQFSRPEQLEQLRECCVQYLEIYPKQLPEHHIAYIRLLEDQQCEIRLEMARIVAKKLGVNELNDEVLKNMILQKISLRQFESMLTEVSDYQIKRRNAQQQRIFSYDKPNKYRSDISNLIYSLIYNPNLKSNAGEVTEIMRRVFAKSGLELKEEKLCINKYIKDIIWRNQYQFQSILRIYFMTKSQTELQWAPIFKSHPLLEKVSLIYH